MNTKLQRDRRGTRIYWTILIVFAIILFFGVFIALRMVWQYAEEFENSSSENVIQEYMKGINQERWNGSMESAAGSLANEYQTADDCVSEVKSTLTDMIKYSKQNSYGLDQTSITYDLYCDNIKIGNVTISEDESRRNDTKFNMLPWKVESDSFDFSYLKVGAVDITVPSTYSVKLNGVLLGEDKIVEKDIKFDILSDYYKEYPGLPTKVEYKVDGLVGNISPTVYDSAGNEFSIDKEKDDSQFMEPCEQSELSALESFASEFVPIYQNFFGTKNVNANYPALMKYVKKGSDLQSLMDQFVQGGTTYVHTNYITINSMKFDSAYSLGGNFYVINETVDSTGYADYKTVNEVVVISIIVAKDGNNILAVSVK